MRLKNGFFSGTYPLIYSDCRSFYMRIQYYASIFWSPYLSDICNEVHLYSLSRTTRLCFLATTDCTTVIYTKTNGGKACGILLPNSYTNPAAVAACSALGARLPEATSLADFNTLTGLMVNKR